jgi:TldD protein
MPVLVPSRLPAGSRLRPVALTVGLSVGAVGALGALGSEPAVAAPKPAADPVLTALEAELERTHGVLRLEDYERPYFVSFRVVDRDQVEVTGRFGALVEDDRDTKRQVAVDVRVGDYSFDSSPDPSDFSFEDGITFEPPAQAPLDADVAALRGTVWLLADAAYKKALSSHLRKRAKKVSDVAEKHVDSFSRESPATHRDSAVRFDVDRKAWAERVRRLSARFRRDPAVLEGAVRISATHTKTWLVSSEGSRIVKEDVLYSVGISALARAPDGMLLDQGQTLYGRTLAELPDERGLSALVDEAVLHLSALSRAPVADPYTGPAILEPEATGRVLSRDDRAPLRGRAAETTRTKGALSRAPWGRRSSPPSSRCATIPAAGRPGRAPRSTATTSTTIEGVPSQQHDPRRGRGAQDLLDQPHPGRGRQQEQRTRPRPGHPHRPVARMGNLIIEAAGAVPRATLKQMLLDETRKAGKPFGLIIRDITGGSTNTSNYGYQAFKGSPRMVYRVDAQTGAETLVRGVEMVGTPLTAVNKIVAASQEVGVFNGFCGAESGYVPVSTVAPATLFREIELQRSQRQKERTPLLPAPWAPPAQGKHP